MLTLIGKRNFLFDRLNGLCKCSNIFFCCKIFSFFFEIR